MNVVKIHPTRPALLEQEAESTAPLGTAPLGTVYLWHCANGTSEQPASQNDAEPENQRHVGRLEKADVPLRRLHDSGRLSGRFVDVHNDSVTKLPGSLDQAGTPLGDAVADEEGNFCFEPHHGGGRMERHPFVEPEMWQRYIEASRFGEVNSYYHTDAVAARVDGLIRELGYPSLPKLVVRVNSHSAVGEIDGCCNGVLGKTTKKWYPLQGGHYRLPTQKQLTVVEHRPLSPQGEVHLGPGWKLATHGALVDFVGRKYRCNASHNAGTIYHEYGHHLTRHTADFRANRMRAPHRQCVYKTDVDEAICDYLAATMMDSPHIWAFHHRHDSVQTHRRSLVSQKTMDDYDRGPSADPHDNGTILASTLWDLRQKLIEDAGSDSKVTAVHDSDLLVVSSLILIGQLVDHPTSPTLKGSRRLRKGFGTVRQAMLESDRRLFLGKYESAIRQCFKRRKIKSRNRLFLAESWSRDANAVMELPLTDPDLQKLQQKDPHGIVAPSADLLSANQLDAKLREQGNGPYSLVAVGDVMVGSRARNRTNEFGPDYIFNCVAPVFRRSSIVLANQEGPIARDAVKLPRNHSYKVSPRYTRVLRRAGINVVTLANNHLLDCGREGVRETLKSLSKHGIHAIGVGLDSEAAHRPAIMQAGPHSVGLLGYYWNTRTSARKNKPGSAMDTPERLAADIGKLRRLVDRVVVTVHWGVPYDRQPSDADRDKARLMIELGADIVIGHHPHIMQEIELIDGRPVLYSIGNFAFGTGNSKAESLLVGVDFQDHETIVDFYPAYVKNRDPRVNYQPKVMTGPTADEALSRLANLSADSGQIKINNGVGRLTATPIVNRRTVKPK